MQCDVLATTETKQHGKAREMTIEQAKEEMPNIECFLEMACNYCTANDWYCPSYCHELLKAKSMPFNKIQQAYARHDGEMRKVIRYIKQAK